MFAAKVVHPVAPETIFIGDQAGFNLLIDEFALRDQVHIKVYKQVRADDGGRYAYEVVGNELIIRKKNFITWKTKPYRPLSNTSIVRGTEQLRAWLKALRLAKKL